MITILQRVFVAENELFVASPRSESIIKFYEKFSALIAPTINETLRIEVDLFSNELVRMDKQA
jgi:hypothetical protein